METALLVNPSRVRALSHRRRRRPTSRRRRRRNPLANMSGLSLRRRPRRNPSGSGKGGVIIGALAFTTGTLVIRRLVLGSPKTRKELDAAKAKFEKYKPWLKLALGALGYWLSSRPKMAGFGTGLMAAGFADGAQDLAFGFIGDPKVAGAGKKKKLRGLEEVLVERGLSEDDDEDEGDGDDGLEADDDGDGDFEDDGDESAEDDLEDGDDGDGDDEDDDLEEELVER